MIQNVKIIKIIACATTIVISSNSSFAQLSTFVNMQNQMIVWDDGMERKIDYLPPVKVGTGRIAIAYLDNSRNFKIYYKGAVTKINDGFTKDFQVTDNLVTYQNASNLWVWEAGQNKLLSKSSSQFYTSDSLVAYFDEIQKNFNIYYKHQIYPIENFLAGVNMNFAFNADENSTFQTSDIASTQLSSIQVGDNIAAYVNYANQFKAFYRGQILDIEDFGVNSFKAGRNTVAYVDNNNQFKVFQNGNVETLESFEPKSYAVGFDMVAYVSNDGYFKVYYNGTLTEIGYFEPDYILNDNILAYRDARGYFSVFYKGQTYQLESYFPTDIKILYNSLAYVNQANMLRLFTEGKTYDVITGDVPAWQLNYDVLQYRFGKNFYKIFYKGETY